MSGIPTPRSGIARPSKLVGPGTTQPTKRPRPEVEETSQPSKKPKASMPPPKVAPVRKPTASSVTQRKPLSTRNTLTSRSNLSLNRTSNSSLNRTVASAQPTQEKPKGKPKRAPWDLKGKLEDMESSMNATMSRLSALENQNTELKTNVEEKDVVVMQSSEELDSQKKKNTELNAYIEELKSKLKKCEEDFEADIKKKTREVEDLQYTKGSLERKNIALEDELTAKQTEISGLRNTVAEMSALSTQLKTTQIQLESARNTISDLQKLSSDQQEEIQTYQEKQRSYESERRQLHNTIQELKGNIRVFCRIRPLLGAEIEKFGQISHIALEGDKCLEITKPLSISPGNSKVEKFNFEFDHVFGHKTSQEDVFDEVSQLIQSAIDGYNVCVFAYGQTGSGKTFTMEGDETGEHVGIIPKTIHKIFNETRNLVEKGWKYTMDASFLEIYNEEIRDLLATEKGLKYDIKKVDTKSNEIYVTNLKIEDVTSGENINGLLKRAKKNRAVAATNCNERSSRSHSVFMLKIAGKNSITSESCTGTLNLVDLAGSERLKDSGSTGQRLEETKSINSSLSNLSKVIMALANNKDGHVPYRDSKLTHLLMNSLGGNSKTLMFVNLSPREDNFNETLNSLRFAKRVNNCQIGTATKKVNSV